MQEIVDMNFRQSPLRVLGWIGQEGGPGRAVDEF
jgi:hypothetical protein